MTIFAENSGIKRHTKTLTVKSKQILFGIWRNDIHMHIENVMKRIKSLVASSLLLVPCVGMMAQVEERQRPAEWENLVLGGRHMTASRPCPRAAWRVPAGA